MTENGSPLLVDWDATADLLAWAMLSDRSSLVDGWFHSHNQSAPALMWEPAEEDLSKHRMREAHRLWLQQPRVNGLPDAGVLDEWTASPPAEDLTILDAIEGGRDFQHRLFARTVIDVIKTDWTGKRLSSLTHQTYVGIFFMGLYRAICACRRSALILYAAELGPQPSCWQRLLLPFAGASDGSVAALVSCNLHRPDQSFVEPLRSLRLGR